MQVRIWRPDVGFARCTFDSSAAASGSFSVLRARAEFVSKVSVPLLSRVLPQLLRLFLVFIRVPTWKLSQDTSLRWAVRSPSPLYTLWLAATGNRKMARAIWLADEWQKPASRAPEVKKVSLLSNKFEFTYRAAESRLNWSAACFMNGFHQNGNIVYNICLFLVLLLFILVLEVVVSMSNE